MPVAVAVVAEMVGQTRLAQAVLRPALRVVAAPLLVRVVVLALQVPALLARLQVRHPVLHQALRELS